MGVGGGGMGALFYCNFNLCFFFFLSLSFSLFSLDRILFQNC